MFALDLFRFRDRRAQTHSKIVREVIAAHGDCRRVPHHASGVADQLGRAAADIEQADAQIALVLRKACLRRSKRLEHRVVHAYARAVHRRHDILRRHARRRHNVDVRLEALPHHPDGVANVVLLVEKKFLRKHVQHFAVFRQRDAFGRLDRAPHVFALHVPRPRSQRDSALAVHAAHVRPRHADHRRFHRHADDRFRFLHRAPNRTHREIEIHDLPFAPAFRFRRAERREFHAAVIILLAHQRARFRAADIERHNVPFFSGQIRRSLRCLTP